MQLSQLRARVQPALLQDFDAVYEEYVLEVGHGRLRPFVKHLAAYALLVPAVSAELVAIVPDAEPQAEPREPTPAPAPPPIPAALQSTTMTPLAMSRDVAPPAPSRELTEPTDLSSSDAPSEPRPVEDEPAPVAPSAAAPDSAAAPLEAPADQDLSKDAAPSDDGDPSRDAAASDDASDTAPLEDLHAPLGSASGAPPGASTEPAAEPPPAAVGVDLGAETVRLPTRADLEAAEEAAAASVADRDTLERPRPSPISAAKTVELAVTPELLSSLDPSKDAGEEEEWEDVPEAQEDDAPKRTMYRKLTGGQIRETGRFGETPDRPKRRRRRRLPKSIGRYTFDGTVGEGAMGRVLLAKDTVLQRNVAYKAMSEELKEQPALASKFGAEARITAQLDHPNVVPVYSLESSTAYTMKLIEGRTLEAIFDEVRALVSANRPVPESLGLQRRLEWFIRVCEAVSYAHSRGVIHRDLKPENIMVGQWGEVYVMDWGIAKVVDPKADHPVDVPEEQEDEGDLIIGTAGYMSPEQAEGWNDQLTGASDQYALGLILFELVSLRPAVTGKAALKVVMRHQDGERDPLVHLGRERISKELAAIIDKASSKAIRDRFAGVAELADDVRRYLQGEPVRARPDGPLGAILRWIGNHRELTLVAVLVALLGSVVLVSAVAGYGQVRVAQAQATEQRVTNLITAAAKQTSLIDGQFLKVEGLLSVVSTAAAEALQRDAAGGAVVFRNEDFRAASTAPPDAEPPSRGEKYGTGLVSTTTPVFVAPSFELGEDGAVPPEEERRLRLANLGRHFQRVLLRSHSERRAATNRSLARRTILEVEIPVSWAFVALDDGSLVSFPGHGGWPVGLQPRQSSWYLAAQDEQAPVWGRVASHEVTGAPILTVSQALLDATDRTVGVAGLHLAMPRLLELLVPPSLADVDGVEAFLLDEDGRIVLRSNFDGDPSTLNGPFPVASVREAAAQHLTDIERRDGKLLVYNRMTSNGWTYVLQGPAEGMLR